MAQFRSFNSNVPDPSYTVQVTAIMPAAAIPGATGSMANPKPIPVKVDSRINVSVVIENATTRNLPALLDNIKNEVVTKASQLIDIPEVEDVPGFS